MGDFSISPGKQRGQGGSGRLSPSTSPFARIDSVLSAMMSDFSSISIGRQGGFHEFRLLSSAALGNVVEREHGAIL